MKDSCKKGNHEWYVSKWYTKGTKNSAVEFYCKFCMLTADTVDKEAFSWDALEAQSDVQK